MFFLFERSLAERELCIKLANRELNFDIRSQFISVHKLEKIAKVYFSNVSGNLNDPTSAESLTAHFISSLISGGKEAQEKENELVKTERSGLEV